MKNQPDEITICNLSVILMEQGEIICCGKTVGWFKDFKECLTGVLTVTGEPYIEKPKIKAKRKKI